MALARKWFFALISILLTHLVENLKLSSRFDVDEIYPSGMICSIRTLINAWRVGSLCLLLSCHSIPLVEPKTLYSLDGWYLSVLLCPGLVI